MSFWRNSSEFRFFKIANWLFLLVSILLLAYTYYRAEIVYSGSKDADYFKYYITSLILIIFWGGVLWLKDWIQTNVILVTIALLVGLYLTEGVLAIFTFPTKHTLTTELGIEFDNRTKIQVINDLRSEGIDAVPSTQPNVLYKEGLEPLYHLGGMSYKTTVATNETGRYMIYPSDRYGFNNPDLEWELHNIEWLLIGDSFAQGLSVQPGEDIGSQIRKLTKQSVLSLGISGNGPLYELASLKEYAELKEPKRVIWLYYEDNDLTRNLPYEESHPTLMNYLKDDFSQNLIDRQLEINQRLSQYFLKEEERENKTHQLQSVQLMELTQV